MKIDDYLGREFDCPCGRKHSTPIESVVIEKGAIAKIPDVLGSFNYKKVFLIADQNTYAAAGEKVAELLIGTAFTVYKHIYKRETDLVPDERAVGELMISFEKDTDVILAVGSGVINDLSKYISYKLSIPYVVCATASSMDGYASDVAAFIFDNMKITLPAAMPKAIIADTDVLKNAPSAMLTAGFGDILGKYSAINDWKLGHTINGEYYCEMVAEMIGYSIKKCTESPEGLVKRADKSVESLMEALVISGIAMSFTGNSRPASGAEHHLSHFWEMMYLFQGREEVLHGVKVGIGTAAINWLRKRLADYRPDFDLLEKAEFSFDKEDWLENVKTLYSKAASGIIELNEKEQLNDERKRAERLKCVRGNWDRIADILKETPETDEICDMLISADLPTKPAEIGVDRELFKNAVIYAKELRSRYTILQLLWDLDLLKDFADELTR